MKRIVFRKKGVRPLTIEKWKPTYWAVLARFYPHSKSAIECSAEPL